ncbi:cytochrome P450 2L1-like isoform X2 [Rhipicephalus microplus]|uniref:cytochrome P450 2L1-like isoform X2 n=1 Tax=Rhipicephalus microplus TaxID=6941 RepID=UPI003F6ADB91
MKIMLWNARMYQAALLECNWSGVTACLAAICVVLVGLRHFLATTTKQEKKLPPGPRGLPILGSLPFIRKPYHVAFKKLSESYGPIIRLRLGCREVVVLNDLESIRTGLSNADVLYRPKDFLLSYLGVKGIASLNGEPWQVNRRYCFHVLRNLGFAKKSMEEHIQEEIQCFLNFVASAKGQPMLISQKLAASVANNISALVFGRRYDLDDPRCQHIEELLSKFLRNGSAFSLFDFIPIVRLVSSCIPNTKICILNDVVKNFVQVIRAEVKKREDNMENYLDRDFIDGYLRKIEENKTTNSHFNLNHLEGNAINLYGAATNTVRTTILWTLYIAASDPDGMQARVQREIDAVIGRNKPIEWEDRRRLPYTMAAVLETLRWRTTAPMGVHRIAMSDTEVCGYHVPAGTFVIANLWCLHNDPTYWCNPLQYDPTRFLNSDGTELAEKPLAFLPFSVGRRACPGETLGLMEVFLYVATLLQHFRVLPEDGAVISLEANNAAISVANDTQKLRFVRR